MVLRVGYAPTQRSRPGEDDLRRCVTTETPRHTLLRRFDLSSRQASIGRRSPLQPPEFQPCNLNPWEPTSCLSTGKDLFAYTIVEPSCGSGAFLLPMVERLIASCEISGRNVADAPDAIRAFDLLDANATLSRKSAIVLLVESGVEQDLAEELGRLWVQVGDFLLTDHEPAWADFVVGNPPSFASRVCRRS